MKDVKMKSGTSNKLTNTASEKNLCFEWLLRSETKAAKWLLPTEDEPEVVRQVYKHQNVLFQ